MPYLKQIINVALYLVAQFFLITAGFFFCTSKYTIYYFFTIVVVIGLLHVLQWCQREVKQYIVVGCISTRETGTLSS